MFKVFVFLLLAFIGFMVWGVYQIVSEWNTPQPSLWREEIAEIESSLTVPLLDPEKPIAPSDLAESSAEMDTPAPETEVVEIAAEAVADVEPTCPREALTQRVRDVISLQAEIVVPHELESHVAVENERFVGATVLRVEPDSLHLRHASGLERLGYEQMPPTWWEAYHIDPDAADWFRAVRARHSHEAARASAARATAAAAHERAARQAHGSRLQQIEQDRVSAEEERRTRNLVRAWQRYDRDVKAYDDAVRRSRQIGIRRNPYTGTIMEDSVRTVRIPSRPVPPSHSRPSGYYPDGPRIADRDF